jgi:hypothetical protein
MQAFGVTAMHITYTLKCLSPLKTKAIAPNQAYLLYEVPHSVKMSSTISSASNIPLMDLFSLRGKTAIVTGGTGGIGLPTTTALAEAGANIVSIQAPNDNLGPKLRESIESQNRVFTAYECDLMDSEAIQKLFQQMWTDGVVPDILVNGAGITHHSKITETSLTTLNKVSGYCSISRAWHKCAFRP